METREYRITCAFDDEAEVWYVSQSDMPGLSIEADSEERMVQRIREILPELLRLNSHLDPKQIETAPVELLWAQRSQRLQLKPC